MQIFNLGFSANTKSNVLVLSKLPCKVPGGVEAAVEDLLENLERNGVQYDFIPTGDLSSLAFLGNRFSFLNILKLIVSLVRVRLVILHVPNPVQSLIIYFWKLIFPDRKLIVFYHSEILVFGRIGKFFGNLDIQLCKLANFCVFSSTKYAKTVLKDSFSDVEMKIFNHFPHKERKKNYFVS